MLYFKKQARKRKVFRAAGRNYAVTGIGGNVSRMYLALIARDRKRAFRGFSKPSISRAMKHLKEGGFINVDENGFITLTESGRAVAEKIYERHTVLSDLFERLGVPDDVAAEDACRIEHVISDESFAAIKRFIREEGDLIN